MQAQSDYILKVGDAGQERLAILNELMAPSSTQLLLSAGLTGKKVLEIGCGPGNMTCWIAKQVGPNGQVFAIDNSAEQLNLAKQQMATQQFTNVTFLESSVYDLKDLPKDFDLMYSRFLLSHVKNPYEALEILKEFVKPRGRLVCEEVAHKAHYWYPETSTHQRLQELLDKLVCIRGIDSEVGDKLFFFFNKLNLKNIDVNFVQPIYKTQREKLGSILFYQELKPAFLKEKIVTEKEIDQLIDDYQRIMADENYLASFRRVTQIIGEKL